ncbi:RNA polymerase sigma factor [Actinomadura opuntiae]|uniref:RNA polymerase sigma factor n=1 Tax=Actinomadura sp. OS1-43 TaxID=604315 RepID=UPI00255A75F3|nr:RNA polymerase sigma factor [Actinomadura sp. OS1-43]MDL4817640.1 RNA polymerase sigma factor [Actinomadura sp. OS1-43]
MTVSPRAPAPPGATTEPPEDDARLIERSRHRPEDFAALYDRHAPSIHRYVARRLGEQAADDVVAETFLAAFRQRDRYDLARRDARPWLYGIAANLVGKHRRSETRMLRALARTGADPVTDAMDRVDARVSAAAASRPLAGALAGLSRGDRDVLLLVAWADLSYEQVAEALSIPVGTVRSRLHRARRKVREALGGTDPTDVQEGAGE